MFSSIIRMKEGDKMLKYLYHKYIVARAKKNNFNYTTITYKNKVVAIVIANKIYNI